MKNMRFAGLLCGVLMSGLMVSCMGLDESDPSALQMPEVKTFKVKDNGSLVFELSATIDEKVSARIAECGFYYAKDKDMSNAERIECRMLGNSFSADLTLREYGETYYICSYISNGSDSNEILSNPEKVQIKDLEDYVEFSTPEVVSYDKTSAEVKVKYEAAEGVEVSEFGLSYGIDLQSDGIKVKATAEGSVSLRNLVTGKAYQMRSYFRDGDYEIYGKSVSLAVYGTPVVITVDSPKTDSGSAVLPGKVEDDCGKAVTERGFIWCEGAVESLDVDKDTKIESGSGTGEFTETLAGLSPNRIYSFCAYAKNSEGFAYGQVRYFTTKTAMPSVGAASLTSKTSSMLSLIASVLDDGGEAPSEAGFYYSLSESCDTETSNKVAGEMAGNGFSAEIPGLSRVTEYFVRAYAINSAGESIGDVVSFVTDPELPVVETVEVSEIMDNSAVSGGRVIDDGGAGILSKGIVWSTSLDPTLSQSAKTDDGVGAEDFTSKLINLNHRTTYYVRAYATNSVGTSYGQSIEFMTEGALDLSSDESANCYIISESGTYRYSAVKGNSSESVGTVQSVEVLWESFGTSITPNVGDLIKSVSYSEGYIVFQTNESFKEGNAVIAAKDANGTILWSWHIWLTDQPGECVYANNAGTMMDRNLGATSATPGDVGALGLLYQWGRKDPFLGSSSISSNVEAKSTITWPYPVTSSSSCGTVGYAVEHPTTFIKYNNVNQDWYYTGSSSTDNTRWQSEKTIYDPCPAGWRTPDCVWDKAGFDDQDYDDSYKGMLFGSGTGSPATWYPASGCRQSLGGMLYGVGYFGYNWSVTPLGYDAYCLCFGYDDSVCPTDSFRRADGNSVRCLQK